MRDRESLAAAGAGIGVHRIRLEESIEIACPPEGVSAVVADPLDDPRWCPKVKSVEAAGDRRWTVIHKPVPCEVRWS